ncbi:Sialic acid TRAP transporter permease protein SiaT [Oceanobacillus oncorhynchi]|uniref:Sialic acid TRAP transporter permease protein SiaT n=1 Tax=Oceanobacillus oncorhynchi TaxID=545501 RepID=A0A0A1MN12_9BACI|nr:TRAP transporter large permease [Oceanobacillus oncorhynchi]CEI80486.1 Sialic acid TRAP transporter permease protein SiaT [Oceanobacillus oncorhynchi]
MIWLMIISFFLLIVIGTPIAFAMGASSIFFILVEGIPLSTVAQRFFSNTQSFAFLAVPFFVLAGNLMVYGGIAQKLINVADSLVRRLPGGLGCVSVVTSMGMAGVSGSSVADAASVGSVLIPEMKKKGYSASFSAAINATSSVVGIIIPPSSTMIILAWLANLSVAEMFLAGIIPGFLIGFTYLAVTIIIAIRRGYPKGEKTTVKEIVLSFVNALWALLLPLVLIAVIVMGVATATEASAVAAIYAAIIAFFVYRSLKWRDFLAALRDSVYSTASVMIIVCAASIFTWVLINEGVPQLISNALLDSGLPNWTLLIIMVLIMFLFGMVMDLVPNLFIFIPIFFPIATGMGMEPIQFSLIMLVTLALGLFTPPVGTTLFISLHLAKVEMEDTIKDLIPFGVTGIAVVMLITFIPELTLWIPNLLL